jgi:hypothetical protein
MPCNITFFSNLFSGESVLTFKESSDFLIKIRLFLVCYIFPLEELSYFSLFSFSKLFLPFADPRICACREDMDFLHYLDVQVDESNLKLLYASITQNGGGGKQDETNKTSNPIL